MLTKQKDLPGRLVGVQEFLHSNDGVLSTINQSDARKALDDVVLQLDRRAVDQDAGFVTGRGEVSRERAHSEARAMFRFRVKRFRSTWPAETA